MLLGKCVSKSRDTISHPVMVTIKTKQKQKTSVSKKMGKFEPCALLLRMQNGAASVENTIAVPQKIKHRVTI